MFPLALLNQTDSGTIVLNMPLTSDYLDISPYSTPISIVSGTPTFVSGALYMDSNDRLRTGAANNQPQAHLDLYNKLYEISFDVKMVAADYPASVIKHTSSDTSTFGCVISISNTSNTVTVSNPSNTGVITHSLGFDSKSVFFNVKLKRTTLTSYELLINNTVVESVSSLSTGVMDNNTNNNIFHGFGIATSGTVAPFYMKNLLVKVF